MASIRIVGLCGSLRRESYNRKLLHYLGKQFPQNVSFTLAEIGHLPFYSADRENPFPESVLELTELLRSADAVVISSPEYNMSYTGVLKNALEWVSRPSLGKPLEGKPAALIGSSAIATAVSQSHLRDVLFALNLNVLNRPIVRVDHPKDKFDEEGNVTDPVAKEQLAALCDELIRRIQA